ncbi:2Fe-2S iron-sulfur cluster-binding protein [Syntrophaceticus schinkii]|uniref:2Fe-2S iron-sulfur cluster-binding protein n=1 Tax=Syntrophaceticus schinkii TaxID=499207 RepID=UPI0009FBB03E
MTVTIDGLTEQVPEGTSVLDTARSIGIYIPTLCHNPGLIPVGACSLCVAVPPGVVNTGQDVDEPKLMLTPKFQSGSEGRFSDPLLYLSGPGLFYCFKKVGSNGCSVCRQFFVDARLFFFRPLTSGL